MVDLLYFSSILSFYSSINRLRLLHACSLNLTSIQSYIAKVTGYISILFSPKSITAKLLELKIRKCIILYRKIHTL